MLGKTEGRRRKGCQRMRWLEHHRCNDHELGQTPGDGEGQGGLAWCSPWGHDWGLNNRNPEFYDLGIIDFVYVV